VDWIHLAQDRVQWWAVVNTVMNLGLVSVGVSTSRGHRWKDMDKRPTPRTRFKPAVALFRHQARCEQRTARLPVSALKDWQKDLYPVQDKSYSLYPRLFWRMKSFTRKLKSLLCVMRQRDNMRNSFRSPYVKTSCCGRYTDRFCPVVSKVVSTSRDVNWFYNR
jgi:hypothetical protein